MEVQEVLDYLTQPNSPSTPSNSGEQGSSLLETECRVAKEEGAKTN